MLSSVSILISARHESFCRPDVVGVVVVFLFISAMSFGVCTAEVTVALPTMSVSTPGDISIACAADPKASSGLHGTFLHVVVSCRVLEAFPRNGCFVSS